MSHGVSCEIDWTNDLLHLIRRRVLDGVLGILIWWLHDHNHRLRLLIHYLNGLSALHRLVFLALVDVLRTPDHLTVRVHEDLLLRLDHCVRSLPV